MDSKTKPPSYFLGVADGQDSACRRVCNALGIEEGYTSLDGALEHIQKLKDRAFKAESCLSDLTCATNRIVGSFTPFLKSFEKARDEFDNPMIGVFVPRDQIVAALRACKEYNRFVETQEKGDPDEL